MRAPRPHVVAIVGAILALIWAGLVAAPHLLGRRSPVDALESALVDLRLLAAGPRPVSAPVAVVAIDDRTLARGSGGYPVSRAQLAAIVAATAEAGAGAIAVDVLLVDRTDPAADGTLARTLERTGAVLAAAGRFGRGAAPGPLPRATSALWPAPVFADRARVGMVNIVSAPSGTPRHAPLMMLTPRGVQPHLVLQALAAFTGERPTLSQAAVTLGDRSHPLDLGFHLPLRIRGPGGTLPTVSAADLLQGGAGPALRGRLAVIGFTASAVGDTFTTPFDPVTPGVEIIAGAAAQLLDGEGLARTVTIRRVDAGAAVVLAVAAAVIVPLVPLAVGLGVAGGLLALWLVAAGLMFGGGIWLSMGVPLTAAVPPLAAAGLARHLHERRLAALARRGVTALQRFHAPALARRLAEDPDYLARPERRRLSILFVDLAGFTGLSEALGLDGTQALLKTFHARAAGVVGDHGGLVLNFLGDGLLAVFGLPESGPDDADRALAAALALVPTVRAVPPPVPGAGLDARVGLHKDEVVVSRLGHDAHQQVTVAGDGVNLASRLMGVAKTGGAGVAASTALMEALTAPPPQPPTSFITAPVRGRRESVVVALWQLPRLPAP